MERNGQTRRLAAILAADVVGYSRLMGADDAGTLAALRAILDEIVKPTLEAHNGRLVKLMGDGALAEFPSVVDAVTCAAAIQSAMEDHAPDEPQSRRIRFRIGINLGDIIIEDDDIFGDGVNVAARLEALAEPGGICVSRTVVTHVGDKAGVGFQPMGAQKVKNIAAPVEAYRVVAKGAKPTRAPPRLRRRKLLAALSILAIVVVTSLWLLRPILVNTTIETPTGPRVAVLPFDNFSDAEQDWFSDGLTEDIITRLSHFNDVQVIARNSTARYKGMAVDVREVGRDLGADYVLEGSVRRSRETLRVTAQLLDAKTADHVWAEEYDRPLTVEDVFEIQDDLSTRIVAALGGMTGAVATKELAAIKAGMAPNIEGYDCTLLARYAIEKGGDQALFDRVMACLDRTLARSPEYAEAWAWKSKAILHGLTYGLYADEDAIAQMKVAAERAVELAPLSARSHHALLAASFSLKEEAKAEASARRIIEINPRNADLVGWAGFYMIHLGELEEGKTALDLAFDLTPHASWFMYFALFHYHYGRQEFEQAFQATQSTESGPTNYWWYLFAAVALVELDRLGEANAEVAKARAIDPGLDANTAPVPALWWWALPDKGSGYVAALKKAGLDLTSK